MREKKYHATSNGVAYGWILCGGSITFIGLLTNNKLEGLVKIIVVISFVACLVILLFLLYNRGVTADKDGLTTKAWFRSKRFLWKDIQEFGFGYKGDPIGHIITKDGDMYPLWGTEGSIISGEKSKSYKLLSELNNNLEEWKSKNDFE